MTKRRCENCVFWTKDFARPDEVMGKCRIHPPRYDPMQGSVFPLTGNRDWCGKFRSHATDGAAMLDALDVDDA